MAHCAAVNHAKNRKRQVLLERQRKREVKNEALVDEWFAKFDKSGDGELQSEELSALLRTFARNDDVRGFVGASASIKKSQVLKIVSKFRAYLAEQEELDAIFARYDSNRTGYLDQDQLFALMRDYSRSIKIKPDRADLDFVMSCADEDRTGTISREELLPAIATWKHLVSERHYSSRFCSVN